MPQRPDSEVSDPAASSRNLQTSKHTFPYVHSKRWLRIAYSMYFLESMIAIATSEVAFLGLMCSNSEALNLTLTLVA